MGDVGFVGHGGDEFVTASGQVGGHPVLLGGEWGEDEQAAPGCGDGPLGRKAFQHRTGRAQNDRCIPTQKDLQTFLFHRRMETTDDAAPGVTPLGGLVVGGEDDAAGALFGTEQRGFRQRQQFEIAEHG